MIPRSQHKVWLTFMLVACCFLTGCESLLQSSGTSAGTSGNTDGDGDYSHPAGTTPMAGLGGGGVDGNGGDVRGPWTDTAWFVNIPDGEIKYCLRVAGDFGVSAAAIDAAIQHSFATWFAYIQSKEADRNFTIKELEFPTKASRHSSRPLLDIVGAFDDCGGAEDIEFQFGTSSSLVTSEQQKYELPAAFGARVPGDRGGANSVSDKGVIWVSAPQHYKLEDLAEVRLDWQDPLELGMILNHELGQVFGIAYVPGTIMDQDTVKRYLRDKLRAEANGFALDTEKWRSIDQEQELLQCLECEKPNVHYRGRMDESLAGQVEICPDSTLVYKSERADSIEKSKAEISSAEDFRNKMGADLLDECDRHSLVDLLFGDAAQVLKGKDLYVEVRPLLACTYRSFHSVIEIEFYAGDDSLVLELGHNVDIGGMTANSRSPQRALVPVFRRYTLALDEPAGLSSNWRVIRGRGGLNAGVAQKIGLAAGGVPLVLEFNGEDSPMRIYADLPSANGTDQVILFEADLAINPSVTADQAK